KVSDLASIVNLHVGESVTGEGIQSGTRIVSLNVFGTILLNKPTTLSGTSTLVFSCNADIAVTTALLVDLKTVQVSYNISDSTATAPIDVNLYWSQPTYQAGTNQVDLAAVYQNLGQFAGGITLTNQSDLTLGDHLKTITLTSPPPKQNTLNYFLFVVADPSNTLNKTTTSDNAAAVNPNTGQSNYGVAPSSLQTPMPSPAGIWAAQAVDLVRQIQQYLQSVLG